MKIAAHFLDIVIGLSLSLLPMLTYADPAEVFLNRITGAESANILFVIDNSGSMLRIVPDSGGKTRMTVMQESLQQSLIDAPSDINVGLMRFGGDGVNGANGVSFPITPIEADAYSIVKDYISMDNLPDPVAGTPVRTFLSSIANSWVEFNGTPLVDALYEGVRYFRGMDPLFGFLPPNSLRAAHPSSYNGTIDSCATPISTWCLDERGGCPTDVTSCAVYNYEGAAHRFCKKSSCIVGSGFATYKSPIQQVCQKNYMVLMTDGEPSVNNVKASLVSELFNNIPCATSTKFAGMGECGPELTRFLSNNDHAPALIGKQNIETFTIGFGLKGFDDAKEYLQQITSPKGLFFEADNAAELTNAFKTILQSAATASITATAPAYTLNSANNLANGQDVFVPVFDKSAKVLWSGNLRKFSLLNGELAGADNQPVMEADGSFKETAMDLWSTKPSGNEVIKGGAASLLDPAKRKLYTDAGGENTSEDGVSNRGALGELIDTNKAITNSLLERFYQAQSSHSYSHDTSNESGSWWYDCEGIYHIGEYEGGKAPTCIKAVDDNYRAKLISFIRGYERGSNGEITTTPRKHMGDIMHSKPVMYDYGGEVKTVFVGTNEGYLHAINANDGTERWAFMPDMLLKNITRFYENNEMMQHVYGVDGQLRVWANDKNRDGHIVTSEGEGIYLFFGLGRGGSRYYALDITDPNAPTLKWTIKETSSGFSELAETWSKPVLARMMVQVGNEPQLKDVLVFGAGYDLAKDEADYSKRVADKQGRDVYIVDALSGALLWSIKQDVSSDTLKHSVVGDIRVLDVDRNGSLDRLYFADTGGDVWRVDMDMDTRDTDTSLYDYGDARLTKLAELGDGSVQNNISPRMFFSEPDAAMQIYKGKPTLTVALGSGYRMHPLNTGIQDRFYVLKDDYPLEPRPLTAPVLKEGAGLVPHATLAGASFLDDADKKGWYLPLSLNGEKSLTKAITFMGKVIFSTFAVADESGAASTMGACEGFKTSSRAYVIDLLTGDAVADLNRDGAGNDLFSVVHSADILDAPQLVFKTPSAASGGQCVQGDCQQFVEIRVGKIALPLLDANNITDTQGDSLVKTVDLSKIVPRLYWINKDVSPQP